MRRRLLANALLISLLGSAFVAGPGDVLHAGTSYKETVVRDAGTIRGRVHFTGDVSKVARLAITKDMTICGKATVCPRLCLDAKGGVENAVISLEAIDHGKKLVAAGTPVVYQRKCGYDPHIVLLPLGGQLEIVNGDPILHNVHACDAESGGKTIFNIAQPIKGQRTPVKMTHMMNPGIVDLTCDAGHPWMSGYVFVVDQPYYALTGANGSFILKEVPPGTYKIRMWHEGVAVTKTELENGKVKKYYYEEPYVTTKDVTVPSNGIATVDFEFSLR